MLIIGISLSHDGTITVFKDGKHIFSVAEERLNRIKSYIGFPFRGLEYVAKNVINPAEVDFIIVGTHKHFPPALKETIAFCLTEDKKYYDFQNEEKPDGFYIGDKDWEKITTEAELNRYAENKITQLTSTYGIKAPVKFLNHHLSHAAAAYYASGFKDALSITMDAYGDGLCSTVYDCRNNKMVKLHEEPYYNSIGQLYSEVTKSCGFKKSRHEGKITGLAAYGNPKRTESYFDACIQVRDGKFKIQLQHNYLFSRGLRATANFFRKRKENYNERIIKDIRKGLSDADLAAGIQHSLEKNIVEYISWWQKKTGLTRLVLCGGVFANVKANQRASEIPGVDELFIYPDMGDGGNAYGAAAYYYFHELKNVPLFKPLENVYFGPSYPEDYLKKVLDNNPALSYRRSAEIEKDAALMIHEGKIVGWFQGSMEYGPRALGNRSILASPVDTTINKWLNERLKRTEFMPFAPSCLFEYADELFEIRKAGFKYPAMFMTITFNMKEKWLKKAPAVAHIDNTARPQLVTPDSNPKYYRLLKEYLNISGLPLLINTSFNVHEEPIVCSPEDAVKPLIAGVIDVLILDNYVCEKISHRI